MLIEFLNAAPASPSGSYAGTDYQVSAYPLRFGMRLLLREPVNALTHLLGAVLSIIGLVILIVAAINHGSARDIAAVSIFGGSLVAMYGVSAVYHASTLSERGLGHFQRIDHVMIYILIAGTYTPVCLVVLRGRLGMGLAPRQTATQRSLAWILSLATRWRSCLQPRRRCIRGEVAEGRSESLWLPRDMAPLRDGGKLRPLLGNSRVRGEGDRA